jgi:hypothetical protein
LKGRKKIEENSEDPDRDGCRYGTAESKEAEVKGKQQRIMGVCRKDDEGSLRSLETGSKRGGTEEMALLTKIC